MNNKIDGYKKLIQIIDEYNLEDMKSAKRDAEKQVFAYEFSSKHNITIDAKQLSLNNGVWITLPSRLESMYIGTFGKKYNRTVMNNKQDVDEEILLYISFPTGAYIFGDDYPQKFFEKFYSELKEYKPKYCDDMNHGLYFSMDNAENILNTYDKICDKYIKENRSDLARRRAEKLRKEADQIEAELLKISTIIL